jgi:cell shape-determining protein MreC
MDAITGYISAHPGVLIMIVVFIIILILHFVFKSLIKLALIMLLILLAASGYYYLKDPDKMPEKIDKSINMMKSGFNEIVDKSKGFFKDTKELYKESKEVPSDFNKMLKESERKSGK